MKESILTVENLYKSYGKVAAAQGVSFSVEKGSLFSFLGVNGAGKSTTINIICSILGKDSGKIYVDGLDLDTQSEKIKPLIGVVFQNSVLDNLLTVKDNLTIRASFYGINGKAWQKRLGELSELLDLKEILNRPFGRLSGGQRRRADIARGLINSPRLLILDEPTTGLDPQTRLSVWNTVKDLQQKTEMTVFLTTHYMEEADSSDRVVIIDGGKIAAEDTPVNLKNKYSKNYLYLYGENICERLKDIRLPFENAKGGARIVMQTAEETKKFLKEHSELCTDFEYMKGNMDDVFLSVTGKKAEGGI